MGIDPSFLTKQIEDTEIDPRQHKRLGVHLVEYADRNQLGTTDLLELLAMVGLR